ncbi:MAG: GNAT family N-acetyltransferase [Acidobacteriota bacterium]
MLNRPLRIRDYRPEDLEKLHAMDRICFPDGIAFSLEELCLFCNHIDGICRIAENSKGISGFIIAQRESAHMARIITLDVSPEERRHGIGFTLMKDMHRILKSLGVEWIALEVGTGNTPAKRLYEKLQYGYTGFLPCYYGRVGPESINSGKKPANPEIQGRELPDRFEYNNRDAFMMIRKL